MTNAFSLFRSLVVYGICLPLAIFIGYLLATPTDFTTYTALGLVLMLMAFPLVLRFHYGLLILCWNASAALYFLPGRPSFCLMLIFISFGLSFLGYVMNRDLKFISVPEVTKPLLFIAATVIVTAYFNGGIGLNVLGSEVGGGKRYILLLASVIGYFALVAHHIPVRKAGMYVSFYFAGFITSTIGTIFYLISPSLYFLLYIFPTDFVGQTMGVDPNVQITRLGGLATACVGTTFLLLARYGITGILDSRKPWRLVLTVGLVVVSLFGGYRSKTIEIGLGFVVLFFVEGLLRSRLLPVTILVMVLGGALIIPFADKLPLSFQRSLTFLPLKLNPEAELNAQASTDWRIAIWTSIVPTIPQYLLLGKGLGMDAKDLDMMRSMGLGRSLDSGSGNGAALAGDYHNGPLSVIIPFGIWGVIGLLWFWYAGFRVLIQNNKYSPPEYSRYNHFLLTYFIVKLIMFLFVIGSLYSDLIFFTGIVGLSVALNGGVLGPVQQPVARPAMNRFKLANAVR